MFRRLINRLQGKVWGADCPHCGWSAGREDLTKEQARARKRMHFNNNLYCLYVEANRILNAKD